ncbi:MAG: biopolymer transporter ExbD [Pyrinomonadaceae bacterium]
MQTGHSDTKPDMNVTPLIDILLVLLIIFMVAIPLRPAQFKTRIPSQPTDEKLRPNIDSLVVIINPDQTLSLNNENGLGTISEPAKLTKMLADVFAQRSANHAYSPEGMAATNMPEEMRIQKTVFIRAPRSIRYGDVVKVIDGIKGAGANPIGLQLDDLN